MGLVLVEAGEWLFSSTYGNQHSPENARGVQAQNTFDELKQAWEARKGELEARLKALGGAGLFGGGGGYGPGGMYGGGGNPAAQQYAQLEKVRYFTELHA